MDGALGDVLDVTGGARFADSWNDLAVDAYLAEHGTYRRRRHAVFSLSSDGAGAHAKRIGRTIRAKRTTRCRAASSDGSSRSNPTSPTRNVFAQSSRFARDVFGKLAPDVSRLACRSSSVPHRGARRVRQDCRRPKACIAMASTMCSCCWSLATTSRSGTTTIHDRDGTQLGSFTLTHALDAALVDDARVFHGVTPVRPLRAAEPAFRDVLVVTLSRKR